MSDTCISLASSTTCPAFNTSSISTNSNLFGDFPFLQGVSNVTDFDAKLSDYVKGPYVQSKYVELLGCQGANLNDTADFYARYTTTVICNGLVQSSKSPCGLTAEQSRPVCADTCALMATNEEEIVVNLDICGKTTKDYMKQIRADFTVCSLPADSLTGTCISGAENEPDNCGYGTNLPGLCQYCSNSSSNSTDSCCADANAPSRCKHVPVPTTTTPLQPLVPSSSNTSAPAGGGAGGRHGLSGGQIAGAVVGSVAGFALLAILAALLFLYLRRRRRAPPDTVLNQPNPQRKGATPMQYSAGKQGYEIVPGGRVARMSALREVPSRSPSRTGMPAAIYGDSSESEGRGASPGAMSRRIPPVTGRRHGSLSSSSVLAGLESDTSPRSAANQYSSPEGLTSSQSEQLAFFRDYYSQDDIHPGDKVAVLWAYQPRAGDEFELDRGDMLKVIGIWDDGWATGVRVPERAEDFDANRLEQRDSGLSNASQRARSSPVSEIKAFPLVCVCLPQHWRKIVEGDGQDNGGSP